MTEEQAGKPKAKTGLAHLWAAAGYSAAGARRMWREAAFRQELAALVGFCLLFLLVGAQAGEFLGLLVLGLIVMAIEALNTAIEEVVDHVSPGWSEFAKNAKDMGSFAVMCALVATGLYAAWVVFM
ncbi:diacylglycerol kinase [Tabrizicola sp.]|uniref:diacylglycerol kinase n=1 Tax=Tabrizicola sp. TaxID=2005166 RepID=UPI003F3B7CC7